MNRVKLVGLCVGVTFAVGAVVSAPASALPEFGRCVAKAGGKYKENTCQKKLAGGGFERLKGVGAILKTGFTSASGKVVFENAAGARVECETGTDRGVYKAPTAVEHVMFMFRECKEPALGVECKTPGAALGEIITRELKGKLGYINKPKKEVGLSLTPAVKNGIFVEFECGAGVLKFVVAGKAGDSVIAAIIPVNIMTINFILTFKQAGGVNIPAKFAVGAVDVLEVSVNGGAFEPVGLTMEDLITNEEEIETFA